MYLVTRIQSVGMLIASLQAMTQNVSTNAEGRFVRYSDGGKQMRNYSGRSNQSCSQGQYTGLYKRMTENSRWSGQERRQTMQQSSSSDRSATDADGSAGSMPHWDPERLQAKHIKQSVLRAAARMDQEERAITLYYFGRARNVSYIAKKTGCSVEEIEQKLQAARTKIANELAMWFDEQYLG